MDAFELYTFDEKERFAGNYGPAMDLSASLGMSANALRALQRLS